MTNHDRAVFGAAWALVLAGVAVILALVVHPVPSGASACRTPDMPDGSTISVDRNGNATAPFTGGLGFRCTSGVWVRIAGGAR